MLTSDGGEMARYRMPKLAVLDQPAGFPVSKPRPISYEKTVPGELLHVGVKKGRIPDDGSHRVFGRTIGNRNIKKHYRGYSFMHHIVGDFSRLAYSEILDDEKKETAAEF